MQPRLDSSSRGFLLGFTSVTGTKMTWPPSGYYTHPPLNTHPDLRRFSSTVSSTATYTYDAILSKVFVNGFVNVDRRVMATGVC